MDGNQIIHCFFGDNSTFSVINHTEIASIHGLMYDNEMEERTAAEELARKKGYAPDGKWLLQQYKLIEKKWLNILKKEAGVAVKGGTKKKRLYLKWVDLQKYTKVRDFENFYEKHLKGYKPDRPNSGPIVYDGLKTTYRRYFQQEYPTKEKYVRVIDLGGQKLMMQAGRLPTDEEEDKELGEEGEEEADGEAEEEAEGEGDEAPTLEEEGEEEPPTDKGRGKRGRKNRDEPEHDEGANKPLKKRAKA